MDSREALIALNMIEHVGPVRVRQLLEYFGEAPAILESITQLLQVRGIGEETAEAIANWEKNIDLAAELKRIEEFGCHILIQTDEEYPELLRQIYDPPIVLYVKGAADARRTKMPSRWSVRGRPRIMGWKSRASSPTNSPTSESRS